MPDLILVSAGFDSHRQDPLGGMKMSAAGFAGLTRILMNSAAECCAQRLVLTLEGGYHPQALARSVWEVLNELGETRSNDSTRMGSAADPRLTDPVIQRCAHVQAPYWPGLAAG
jgi:acetoin utilization deacetylase AcuC-like enzyme